MPQKLNTNQKKNKKNRHKLPYGGQNLVLQHRVLLHPPTTIIDKTKG